MKTTQGPNRRTFLHVLGGAASSAWAGAWASSTRRHSKPSRRYAYVGSLGEDGRDCVQVFRIEGERWVHVQQLPCRVPVSLAPHPNQQTLYVVNGVASHEGLPQGTVEVFSVDQQSGLLSFVQQQKLSLSGTEPRSLCFTADGRYLVVAIYGGGAYNVLPLAEDGTLGPVKGIFKELGRSANGEFQASAHPYAVIPDIHSDFLLASDFGCDRINVFALGHDGELKRQSNIQTAPGTGPGSIALHPDGSVLYVRYELAGGMACHRYRSKEGVIEEPFQTVALRSNRENFSSSPGSLVLDPAGKFLYTASGDGISLWEIDPASRALSIVHSEERTDALYASPSCDQLYAMHRQSGSIAQLALEATGGKWRESPMVANVQSPVSLAFLSC